MVDEAFIQERDIGINAFVEFAAGIGFRKMHPSQQRIELFHCTVARQHKLQELHGVDTAHQRIGILSRDGRIIVIFAHNGQIHRLRIGNADSRVHVVEQVHVEEEMS